MIEFPAISPVAFTVFGWPIHWYGLMYLLGFVCAWLLGRYRAERYGWQASEIDDLIFYAALGVIIGGRLGYVLFYNFSFFFSHPLSIFKVWDGGMSFHGGLIGVISALWLSRRQFDKSFLMITDFTAPLVPIGIAAGRVANFINAEVWGRQTDVAWAVVFPGQSIARHPSQLYEAFLEGLVLFVILWMYSAKPRPVGAVSGLFLIFYGVFRFIVEFFRQPDVHLGFIAFDWLTMGQLLSIPMILLGSFLLGRARCSNI